VIPVGITINDKYFDPAIVQDTELDVTNTSSNELRASSGPQAEFS